MDKIRLIVMWFNFVGSVVMGLTFLWLWPVEVEIRKLLAIISFSAAAGWFAAVWFYSSLVELQINLKGQKK
jgi:hypothetical protein